MTPQADSMKISKTDLTTRYESSFRSYLKGATEKDLVEAYELGRKAFAQDIGILEIVLLHHCALAGASSHGAGRSWFGSGYTLPGKRDFETNGASHSGRIFIQPTLTTRDRNRLVSCGPRSPDKCSKAFAGTERQGRIEEERRENSLHRAG